MILRPARRRPSTPPKPSPFWRRRSERGWRLTDVLLTHHHADHIQGVPRLKESLSGAQGLRAGEGSLTESLFSMFWWAKATLRQWGRCRAKVIETPGHTIGHVAYHFEEDEIAFCGDTIFSLGCGRAFEAPYAVLWSSLLKLAALPGETQLYCGHEYTEANGRFAITIEPQNPLLKARVEAGRRACAPNGGRHCRPPSRRNSRQIPSCAPKSLRFKRRSACSARIRPPYSRKSVRAKTASDRAGQLFFARDSSLFCISES